MNVISKLLMGKKTYYRVIYKCVCVCVFFVKKNISELQMFSGAVLQSRFTEVHTENSTIYIQNYSFFLFFWGVCVKDFRVMFPSSQFVIPFSQFPSF